MRRLAFLLPKFQEFKKSIENTPVYFIFCHGSYASTYEKRPGRVFTEIDKAHNTPTFRLSNSTYILNLSHINEVGSLDVDERGYIKDENLNPIVINQQNNNFRKILLVNDRSSDVEGLKKPKKGYKNFIATLNRATSCDYPNQLCSFVDSFDIDIEKSREGHLVESKLERVLGIYNLESLDPILKDIKKRKSKNPDPALREVPPTSLDVFDNYRYSMLKTTEYGTPGRLGPSNNGYWFLDEIIEYVYDLQKNDDDYNGTPKGIFVITSCSIFEEVGHRLGWSIDKVQKMVTDADNMYKSNELDLPLLDINEMKIAKENSWIPRSIMARNYYKPSANEERAMNDPESRIDDIQEFFPKAKFFPAKPSST